MKCILMLFFSKFSEAPLWTAGDVTPLAWKKRLNRFSEWRVAILSAVEVSKGVSSQLLITAGHLGFRFEKSWKDGQWAASSGGTGRGHNWPSQCEAVIDKSASFVNERLPEAICLGWIEMFTWTLKASLIGFSSCAAGAFSTCRRTPCPPSTPLTTTPTVQDGSGGQSTVRLLQSALHKASFDCDQPPLPLLFG